SPSEVVFRYCPRNERAVDGKVAIRQACSDELQYVQSFFPRDAAHPQGILTSCLRPPPALRYRILPVDTDDRSWQYTKSLHLFLKQRKILFRTPDDRLIIGDDAGQMGQDFR